MAQERATHTVHLILVQNVEGQDINKTNMKKKLEIDTNSETHITSLRDCHCFECRQWETQHFMREKRKQEEEYVLEEQRRKERKSKT